VSEGGSGSRICQIIGRDIDSLYGGNGTLLGGGDTLLHATHVSGKRGLVTDSGGDTTEQGRHLGTGLSEAENVVNEKKHILALLVTEVFCNGQTSESDTGTGTRRLVHLTKDESDLGIALKVDDTSLNHFVVQVVTLTSTLTDTAENRETTMSLGDVVDKLLDQHSLSDTSTTEETNLSTTSIGSEKVDNLDTSLEYLSGSRLLNERWGLVMDGKLLVALDGATLVNRLTNDVDDTAKSTFADGNTDGGTSVNDLLATDETLGTIHSNSTDGVLTKVGSYLKDETTTVEVLHLQGVENRREILALKLDIDDGTNNSLYRADGVLCLSRVCADGLGSGTRNLGLSFRR
jgi:peptide chain release factor 1